LGHSVLAGENQTTPRISPPFWALVPKLPLQHVLLRIS